MRASGAVLLGSAFLALTLARAGSALAQCEGSACRGGAVYECTDRGWILKSPYERCQARKDKVQGQRPPIQYRYPPKRKAIVVPSPQLSPAERSGVNCRALMARERQTDAECDRSISRGDARRLGGPGLASACDETMRLCDVLRERCPANLYPRAVCKD